MSSMAELLKEAYEKNDWNRVAIVYNNLTGVNLPPKAQQETHLHAMKQQSQQLYVPLQDIEYQMPTQENKKYARPEQINLSKSNINLFSDDGTEYAHEKLEVLKRKEPELYEDLNRFTPKVNKGSDMVNVICRKCNKPKTVSRTLVTGSKYICDSCIGHP